MKKNLLLTFDYELFLGPRSGQPIESIIEPTERIRKVINPKGIKAIFFVDTTYLITLEKFSNQHPACAADLKIVSDQIKQLISDGHYIFPHIHPHWLDAEYDAVQHQFNLSDVKRYRFHNLTEHDRELVFRESFRILNTIINSVDSKYQINGFRAGGWSIQPFSDFKPFFERFGIKYDFSVMAGLYQFSNAQYFDFSNAPGKPVYAFNSEVSIEDQNGHFVQVSSSVLSVNTVLDKADRLHRKILYKLLKDHTYTRGIGQQSKRLQDVLPVSEKGVSTSDNSKEPASVELMSIVKLPLYLKFIEQNDFMHFVSHPKMLSRHNLSTLDKFLTAVCNKYTVVSDYLQIVAEYLPINKKESVVNQFPANVTNPHGTETTGMTTISVVVPCYNVANYIEEGLRSVLAQSKPPLEIICVDDGSSDETVDIVKKLQIEFPGKIQLLINDGNRGATYTRNRGLAVARGEYIQFFDADDILINTKFEYQTELINNAKVKPDILVGSCKKLFLDGSEKMYLYEDGDPWVRLMDAMLGVTTSNLFKKSKLLEINGWSESLKSSQEYDLMFRMMQKDAIALIDQKIVSVNRERPFGSITKTNPGEKWKRFIAIRARIFFYLKETNKLTPEIRQTFINRVFDALRILYLYDKNEAIRLHKEYILKEGKPSDSTSSTPKYMLIYNLFGFNSAQKASLLFNQRQKRIH
ncbi:MAG TPA: glycosyltransferase [Bacteroidia bacterium]|jgi:glycosyltransferase involved in cell wall biosynthesis|nr:glycosyltransferase [Bacteroidia bacterium]